MLKNRLLGQFDLRLDGQRVTSRVNYVEVQARGKILARCRTNGRPDQDFQWLVANLALYQGELLPGFYDERISLERENIQAVFNARIDQLLEKLTLAERWFFSTVSGKKH